MEVDLAHGHVGPDGSSTQPVPCPKCKRPVSRRHSRCIYCGAECRSEPFAR